LQRLLSHFYLQLSLLEKKQKGGGKNGKDGAKRKRSVGLRKRRGDRSN
jgi:hypothetical protein